MGASSADGGSSGPVFEIVREGIGAQVGVHAVARDDDGTSCAGSTSGDMRVDLHLDWIARHVDLVTDAPAADGERTSLEREEEPVGACAAVGGGASGIVGALAAVLRGRRRRVERRGDGAIG